MTTPDERRSGALRLGVLHGAVPDRWQLRCIEQLEAVPGVQTIAFSAPVGPSLLARIRGHDLDILLCLNDGPLPAELMQLSRRGVWRYHWGDAVNYGGSHGGFWEVYDGCPVSAALLICMHTDPTRTVVLREGFLRTRLLSVRSNREQLRTRFTHWPAQVCAEIARGVGDAVSLGATDAGATVRSITLADEHRRGAPSLWQRGILWTRIAARVITVASTSLFRHDQWNIGIIDRPIAHVLDGGEPAAVAWLPATPRAELRADPFGIVLDGRETILCEYFSYRDNQGYIVAMDASASAQVTRVRIGPETPVHLSYPSLVAVGDRLMCIPESSAAHEVALYDVERFPDRWKRSATLIAGLALADATVFHHAGSWWLAASDVADKGANSELHLWFADDPVGPWTPHPGNPVKIDVRSARPAGAPFLVGDVLYRPAQDCSSAYGARVIINRIETLTREAFHEVPQTTVNPDPDGPYPKGLHTLSSFGDKTLIDGKRSIFVPAEFFRVLRHYLP